MHKSLKIFAPLALAACVSSAFADDSSVTLYGILDASVANIEHSYNFDALMVSGANPLSNPQKSTQSATGMFSGALSPSRWGIKGVEDMGGGNKAVFVLESMINIQSGQIANAAGALTHNSSTGPNVAVDSAISGQLFSRQSYVGASGAWGQLTFGRHTAMLIDNIGATDPLEGSLAFSPIGYAGSYGGGGFTDDSRVDNSLKYKINFGEFTLGLLYKFGGVSGSTGAQGSYQASGSYVSGPLGVYLAYEQYKDAFSLGDSAHPNGEVTTVGGNVTAVIFPNLLPVTAADTKAFMVSAKYKIADSTIKAGYERQEYNNPSNPASDQALTSIYGYDIGSMNVTAFNNQKTQSTFWVGGRQEITSAWSAMLGLYHVTQNGYDCVTNGAGCSGSANYYSLVGDYRFSKRTDAYIGIMTSTVSGGIANGNIVKNSAGAIVSDTTSNRITAIGMRHTF